MKGSIANIGGEFALIERLLQKAPLPEEGGEVLLSHGDDAAVLAFGERLLAVSVDTFVSGKHFGEEYFSAEDIGIKALEAAASDIVAVGGKPEYALIALSAPKDYCLERLEGVYSGLSKAAERLSTALIGGDVTATDGPLTISLTVLGSIAGQGRICSRAGAKAGDRIYLSGPLGLSAVGLALLVNKSDACARLQLRHRQPKCRIDLVDCLSSKVTSMIDVSDGLASELWHLSRASGLDFVIEKERIPLGDAPLEVLRELRIDALEAALYGGEDFELLYTVPADKAPESPGVDIGVVCSGDGKVYFSEQKSELLVKPLGYQHFR